MIILFAVFIFCFDQHQASMTTFNEAESLEKKDHNCQKGQLSLDFASTGLVEFKNQTLSQTTIDFPKTDKVNKLKQSSTTTVEPKSPTQPVSAPNLTTTTGKAFDKEIGKGKIKVKVKVKAANSDRPKYNFKPSGIGDSWLIGADNSDYANAFTNGISGCTPELTIPSTLTDDDGNTKPVEIIGQYAFFRCAYKDKKGQTRKLTLTKQVKVIKFAGIGGMQDLEEFKLEEGSVLETMERYGLFDIGLNTGSKDDGKRVTLTLPSTLSSVFGHGIYHCDLFNVIIYCGSNTLSNSSDLETSDISRQTVVKVSSRYPPNENIFGLSPDRNSESEVEESCSKMEVRTTPSLSPFPSHSRSPPPTPTPSYNCPFTPHPLPSFLSLCLISFFTTLLPSKSISSKSFSSQALFLKLI